MPDLTAQLISFNRQKSITYIQFGIVIELSAIFVAKITFLYLEWNGGSNNLEELESDNAECKGIKSRSYLSSNFYSDILSIK